MARAGPTEPQHKLPRWTKRISDARIRVWTALAAARPRRPARHLAGRDHRVGVRALARPPTARGAVTPDRSAMEPRPGARAWLIKTPPLHCVAAAPSVAPMSSTARRWAR